MSASIIEETKKQEIPPEFRSVHLICVKCYPEAKMGDIATALCGFTKPVEGGRSRSQAHADPQSCLVCIEIDPTHIHQGD